MISKKLLSAVLGIKEDRVGFIRHLEDTKEIHYSTFGGYNTSINIYELMHLMKQWASIEKGYILQTWVLKNEAIVKMMTFAFDDVPELLHAKTEPEVVSMACEIILRRKK